MGVEDVRRALLELARELGDGRQMAILGEGNVSASLDEERFLVKASGTNLATLQPDQLVAVRSKPLLDAVEEDQALQDEAVEALLRDVREDKGALKPSVESLFHAWLLHQPGVACVGHVHPVAVNQVLCSPAAQQYARKRLFPDQVVYCGAESVLVPYVDPGLALARRIAAEVDAFRMRHDRMPVLILLVNHGLIALGGSAKEVAAAIAMAEKAATVFLGAAMAGGPVFMSSEHVHRISDRIDEHYRQGMLRMQAGDA